MDFIIKVTWSHFWQFFPLFFKQFFFLALVMQVPLAPHPPLYAGPHGGQELEIFFFLLNSKWFALLLLDYAFLRLFLCVLTLEKDNGGVLFQSQVADLREEQGPAPSLRRRCRRGTSLVMPKPPHGFALVRAPRFKFESKN
jgi:hypothetical protein